MIRKQAFIFIVLFFIGVSMSGCAILTPSQIKEVNKFANAAKNYGTFPGAVIKSHAEIRKTRTLMDASTFKDGERALELVKTALKQEKELEDRADKADKALDILNNYAELLVTLTSDVYTSNLQGSAENLGKAVDNGIGLYNSKTGASLQTFGSSVAAIVRGAGGFYIKHAQAKALKKAVTDADPLVRELIKAVEDLLVIYLGDEDLKSFKQVLVGKSSNQPQGMDLVREEGKQLEKTYERIVLKYDGRQPLTTVVLVANELQAVNSTVKLTKDALMAAEAYRDAHAKLAQNIQTKQSIHEVIDEVQVLADQVKAVQELKKKLENK